MLGTQNLFKPTISMSNSNEKLERAKQYPIEDLYKGNLKRTGKTLMGCCPFHQESTPSFAIYTETNTWNCFAGCGGGDVIGYYQKLHKCSFQEALEALAR